ncbi:MAG TPA: GrpB family protein [Thermoflexales bacterium]|nr:GrpB family protein [Thermoflexales bacterium]HQW34660.1 GrpB family protein [Thermoflexales bacterium]HQX75103.1 GrpB family protein [Thermoflexales bacterium]HQZ21105.1 GrpB family protein [Thermoflexales bacterium]
MIVIQPYNPNWPNEFEALRAELQAALGAFALRVDHIGSTSVPGLAAKDVIDVQITVKNLAPEIAQRMAQAGFQASVANSDHVPAGEDANPEHWRKFLFKEKAGERRANIHIRVAGNPNQRYALLFRDYLRAHPNSAETVAVIKQQLAKYHADDMDAYYDIKDPVYDLIWDAAQAWAKHTNWKEN